MKKEHIKSFILILLIVNSIQLSAQIWFDGNLWPGGYSFLDPIKNNAIVRKVFGFDARALDGEEFYQKLTEPKRIIVNGGGAREVYYVGTDGYDIARGYVSETMGAFKSAAVTTRKISYEQWENLFKGKSLYIDFGYDIDVANLNRFYDVASSSGRFDQFGKVSGFIITPEVVTNTCYISLFDEEDGSAYEYSFKCNGTSLLKFIEENTYGKYQNDMFAFEINLDSSYDDSAEIERKVTLSPLALINVSVGNTMEKDIVLQRAFKDRADLERFAEKSLSSFGYSPSSLRKAVQNDGKITYVENNATISYYADGTVEYSAVSSKKGLKKSNTAPNCRQAVNDVLSLVGELCKEAQISADSLNLHLSSDLADNKDNKYTVAFTNMYNGITVNYGSVGGHAVIAEVDNGVITSFRMHIADITDAQSRTSVGPVLAAIDSLYSTYGASKITITDVYKCYDLKAEGEIKPKWAFRVDNSNDVLVVGEDE